MKNHPYPINTSKNQVIQNLLSERDTLKAKAELFKDLVYCIDNLINNKAYMPSVEALLKEAKELDK